MRNRQFKHTLIKGVSYGCGLIYRVALDNQMKELRSAERDLSVKQQELDEREAVLREREREFKQQLHLKLSSHGSRVCMGVYKYCINGYYTCILFIHSIYAIIVRD